MIRVAISTLGQDALLSNYGTFLQHYCLRRTLKDLGYDSFRWSVDKDLYKRNSVVYDVFLSLARYVWYTIKHRPHSQLFLWMSAVFSQRRIAKLLENSYKALVGDLIEAPLDGESRFICLMGSDQILYNDPKVWFADLPIGVGGRMIYAGSTDWKSCSANAEWHELVAREIPKFCAVSVREYVGLPILRKYTVPNVEVAKVIDPVLLVKWDVVSSLASSSKAFEKPTLFCYLVNIRDGEQMHLEALERLAAERGCALKILGIQGTMPYVPFKYRMSLSPQGFLAAVRDASYIVTNSFHGAVIALRYQKPFAVVRQKDLKGENQNVRQIEFLREFGLSPLFCERAEDVDAALSVQIEYGAVNKHLDDLQRQSLQWLADSLKVAASV